MKRIVLGLLCAATFIGLAAAQPKDDSVTVKAFEDHVNNYMSLKKSQKVAPKQTASPDQLAQQKKEAREKVHEVRPAARQGEIFTPDVAAYFKRQIQATLHGPEGQKIQASLRHAEPVPDIKLEVNEKYPDNLPLQSTPPSLLLNLPQLPKGLQYRVVGSSLVLYDETTNLIVDFITGAFA